MVFCTFAGIVPNVYLSFFQCLKSINISSKHTKSLCTSFCISLQIPLSVLDTKVKLGVVQFKAFFSTQSPGSLGHPLQTQAVLCVFHSLWAFLLPDKLCIFWFLISWLSILQEFLFWQASDSFLLVWQCYLWLLWMDFFPILVHSEEAKCIHLEERKGNHPSLLISCTICEKLMHIA